MAFIFSIKYATVISKKYFHSVVYVYPNCQNQFRLRLFSWIFAGQTSKTRNLKCPQCNEKNHCVEILRA